YVYEYDHPAISAYDPETGLTTTVSAIFGNDQFTLEASDGIAVTDQTVKFATADSEPIAANDRFIVPENVGVTYYTTDPQEPRYDPARAHPGLVHFAAPGVLWDAKDLEGDPLMALVDPSHPPQHGRLELSPNGSFDYVPDPGFTGTDAFGYFASDGYLASAPAFATIRVAAGT